jgi:tRNA/rRNA methyltransferase/tRNA (cytidine32/uridine32-2'-O)-methyltransferase
MKNMGLSRLRLVGVPPVERAEDRALAYGAWDVLDGAQRHATLEEALAGSSFVAGTSGRRGSGTWTPRRLAEEGAARAGGGRVALVFGPESTGLTRAELRLCHVVVHIPTHPEHSSLNLAQAVLVLAYEIRMSGEPAPDAAPEDRAAVGDLEQCLGALQAGLLSIGYLNPEDPGGILAELRRLLARAGPTRRELALLRGMARQIEWAGSVASRARRSG